MHLKQRNTYKQYDFAVLLFSHCSYFHRLYTSKFKSVGCLGQSPSLALLAYRFKFSMMGRSTSSVVSTLRSTSVTRLPEDLNGSDRAASFT